MLLEKPCVRPHRAAKKLANSTYTQWQKSAKVGSTYSMLAAKLYKLINSLDHTRALARPID